MKSKPSFPSRVAAGAALLFLVILGTVSAPFQSGAQQVVNGTVIAEPADEFWNPWNFADDSIWIGMGEGMVGELFVPVGAEVLFERLELGVLEPTAFGYLEIDGDGAVVRSETAVPSSSQVNVGLNGNGEILVKNGGLMSARAAYIGVDAGTEGKVTITGEGTVWRSPGWGMRIGQRGKGVVHVLDGALLDDYSNYFIGNLNTVLNDEIVEAGEGELLIAGGSSVVGRASSRIGNNAGAKGTVTVTGADSLFSVGSFLHVGSSGEGTLIVTDGGTVVTGAVHETDRSLSVARQAGSVGHLQVTNEGTVRTGSFFRIGWVADSTGEAVVTGAGSAVEVGSFVQVGFSGQGRLAIREGGRVEVPLTGGSISSAGRHATSTGELLIEGEGSLLSLPRFFLGSDLDFNPTGEATVLIRDGGTMTLGGLLILRNGSTVELDGGTINMVGGMHETRPDLVDIANPGSRIFGAGVINSDVLLSDGGTVAGSGAGQLFLDGFLTGTGTVEAVTLRGVRAVSSAGPLVLNGADFAAVEGIPLVHIVIDAAADVLLTADAATDYSGADLVVEFDLPLPPATTLTFPLFDGEAALNFASVTTPAGWGLQDGVLVHTGEVPVGTPFEDWAAGFGLTGDDALPGANPSGDGFSNAAKFAFGASPIMAVPALAEVEASAEGVTLRWNRLTAAGASYRIERSPTLEPGSWEEVEGAVPTLVADPGAEVPEGYERVEWTAVPAEGKAFYRVVSVLEPSLLP